MKTKATATSVTAFLFGIKDENVRHDSRVVARLLAQAMLSDVDLPTLKKIVAASVKRAKQASA